MDTSLVFPSRRLDRWFNVWMMLGLKFCWDIVNFNCFDSNEGHNEASLLGELSLVVSGSEGEQEVVEEV